MRDWEKDEKIKPRVSREERLRYRREGCSDCLQNARLRRRGFALSPLLVIVAVCAVAYVFNRSSAGGAKVIKVAEGRVIRCTPVSEGSRKGLSLVLENQSPEAWAVGALAVSSPSESATNMINQTIAPKDFAAVFVPLSLKDKKYTVTVAPL